jgi:hypothetical protein
MTVAAIRSETGAAACPRAAEPQAEKMMRATIIFALNFKGTPSVKNIALSVDDQSVKRALAQHRLEQSEYR